jgi:hypothetical protein
MFSFHTNFQHTNTTIPHTHTNTTIPHTHTNTTIPHTLYTNLLQNNFIAKIFCNLRTKQNYKILKQYDDHDNEYDIEMGMNRNQNQTQNQTQNQNEFSANSTLKLEQIPMDKLCIKMFVTNLSWKLVTNMCVNIILSSLLIPLFFKISNDYFVGRKFASENGINVNLSNNNWGILFVIAAILFEITSILHKNLIIEPYKRQFLAKVHCELEDQVNELILQINFNKLRELNKNELDRTKNVAKWRILGFINSLTSTFINMFSFFGYTIWVGIISPISLIVYAGILGLLFVFYHHKPKQNKELVYDLWDKYYNKQTSIFTDIIHFTPFDI